MHPPISRRAQNLAPREPASERDPLRVAFHTFGCRLNQYETDAIGRRFAEAGHEVARDRSVADVVIVNTCTVTEAADREARRFVRRLVSELGPGRVVVTGCSSQRDPRPYAGIAGVRMVTGNAVKQDLPRLLAEVPVQEAGGVPVRVAEVAGSRPLARLRSLHTDGQSENARAYLRVQDGCSQKCTFCTLPGVRGLSASLPLGEVVEQARRLADAGHGEIVLTGAHLGSYGYDLSPRVQLPDLIEAVLEAAPASRVRLSSLEPRFVSHRLLDLLRFEDRLCPHLHLPLQSGDDGVLAAMRRAYRSAPFERRALAAVAAVAGRQGSRGVGMALGSDLMVGFPGEDDRAFGATMALVERLPFTYGHVFPYSNRPGTPAAALPDQVPAEIIRRRSETLRSLLRDKREAFRQGHLGRVVEIVVEKIRQAGADRFEIVGTTGTYLPVRATGAARAVGKRTPVRIEAIGEEFLVGQAVAPQPMAASRDGDAR